jgi:hypothetical protein
MVTKIRLRVGDMQGTKYSDYEVLSALNDARTMLWIALAENFSSIPRRRVELTMVDGQALLPEDFYSLVEEPRGAEICGAYMMRICPAGLPEDIEDVVTLEYNGLPAPSEDMDYIVPAGKPPIEVRAIEGGAEIIFNRFPFPAAEEGSYTFTTPLALVPDVVEISAYVLAGNTDGAVAVAKSTARRVSQKREYAHIPGGRPFP